MDERLNQRLDSVETSIEKIQTTGDDPTGTFLDPTHNCSHILLDHPGSPSGSDIHIHTYLLVVIMFSKHTQVSTGFKGAVAMQ